MDSPDTPDTPDRSDLRATSKQTVRPGSGEVERANPNKAGSSTENTSKPALNTELDAPEDNARESTGEAQPFGKDRVDTDMATAAYDRNWAGATRAPFQAIHTGSTGSIPDEDSDAAIMLHVREGDDSGFTYLIEKYRKQIIHYMFRMTGNQAVAEELAQEVFLRVYRSRESYRAEAKFTTWLYRIATNLGVNYARDHKHEKAAQNVYLDQPDSETGTTPDVADSRLTVEQKLMRNERLAGIKAQVLALPERQRQAVLMHKYQEMDYREIGDVLKLSESATKSLLFRAYQTLRERLKDYV